LVKKKKIKEKGYMLGKMKEKIGKRKEGKL